MMLGSWLGLPSSGKALAVRLAALATSKHQSVLDFWQRSGVETKPLTGSENGGYNMIPPRFMIIYGCGYLMLLFVETLFFNHRIWGTLFSRSPDDCVTCFLLCE